LAPNRLEQRIFSQMFKIKIISKLILFFAIILSISNSSFALNIEEAMNLGIENSIEVQIENKKTEYISISEYEAITDFLPNANLNYRDGTRRTAISSLRDKQKDEVRTLNINQPLFSGFSGVSRYRESLYKTRSAEQNLKFKKNEIALKVADIYFNILKYQKLAELSEFLNKDYQKLIILAHKRLALKDIGFDEFSGHELKAKKNEIDFNQNKIALASYKTGFTHLTNQNPTDLSYPELSKISTQNDMLDFVAIAVNQNPKIKSASLASKAKKSAILAESGKLMPEISLNYQAENQKSSYYFNGSDVKNKTIYLNFSVPIFQSGVEYAGIAKAYKENQIANLEKQLSIKEIERDALEQHQKFLYLKESLSSSISALETSTKALKLAKNRFDKKDLSSMDYLLQEIDNMEIQKQMIAVKCDYLISYYNLKFLIDEISPKN
jgi:outer membrane protein